MELRRPVKPLVPVAMWVRFPPSAPESGADSARRSTSPPERLSRLGVCAAWEHGVTGNMLVSKTSDGGSTPPAPASKKIAEGSHNGIAPVPKTGGLVL